MREKASDFKKRGVQVILAGMGNTQETRAFIKKFSLPFEMICDPKRELYQAYGLKRMGTLGFLSPSLAIKTVRAVVSGNLAGMPEGDVKQLAGVFVIDRSGKVRFRYLSADPADFASAEDILKTVQSKD